MGACRTASGRAGGTVDKAASVTVNGQPARVTSTTGAAPFRFKKDLAVGTGTQTFSIVATDGSTPPQTTTQSYQVNVPAESQSYEHDLNGNLLAVRSGGSVVRGYTWDAANRLVGITYTDGGTTTFQYDGMSQRRIITEKDANGSVTSTTQLLWKGGRVWQEQDSSGRVTKRYHFNGVQTLSYTGASTTPDSTASTLTLTDHLGSHREMVTFSGGSATITGRRDFDPYGKATQTGTVPGNAAYTGHWLHDRSGLELALFRAYDPELGRWLNEDPLEKAELIEGPNLYRYVANSSIGLLDPDGRGAQGAAWGAGIGGSAGAAIGGTIGGSAGAVGGTFVCPGFGTIGGGTLGAIEGGTAGAGFGIVIGGAIGSIIEDIGTWMSRPAGRGGKGERGRCGSAEGAGGKPYKHTRPHPTKPDKILEQKPDGKWVEKPRPPNYPYPPKGGK